MFATIFCTIYFIILISETAAENVAAACFHKEASKRIKERRAITDVNMSKFSNSEKTEREEDISTIKELPKVINADSIQIIMKSSNRENVKQEEANSTEKESSDIMKSLNTSIHEKQKRNEDKATKKEQHSIVKEPQIVIRSSNPENAKIEERILIERESDFSQKLSTEKSQSKVKVKRQSDEESDSDKIKNARVFLTAFKNCKLLIGEYYLQVDGKNAEETKKCVIAELQKLEMFEGEYTKLLDNSDIIRRE